ncbi:MAG: glycoside hydrolase family 13 protein [Propionibacteriaceae bacterium]|nr:glycoside hydrolase family 13 protein [Propionibacteriaceae bacterium]
MTAAQVTIADRGTTNDSDTNEADWWRQAVVYQIYPRSFADANGDGIGDLAGIMSKVDYLAGLGIDAVWLSPFYPSALADGGYDVDDYRQVDPRIGTLDEFVDLVERLHRVGIRVFVDIVPNHSSNRHPWFREALAAAPGSPERARYVFRRGSGEQGEIPPSDWTAAFGGSTWEPVGDGWYYFHLFAPEQPDWNWDNDEVREDFLTTLRFWADRGVDGFRVDVAMGLAKGFGSDHPATLPTQAELAEIPIGPDHPYFDRDDVDEIYAGWREVFNQYDPPRVAVAELWSEPSDRKARYATPQSLGQAFYFDVMHAGWSATRVRRVVDMVLGWADQSGSSSTWVLSNHDVVRHASRLGLPDVDADDPWALAERDRRWLLSGGVTPSENIAVGLDRARALSVFLMGLPGSLYLYQGEELGLPEVADLDASARQDPVFFRSPGHNVGRDGCRVPLPWTASGPSFGFGSAGSHLPQPAWFGDYAVERQEADPNSTLALYRRALQLRRELQGPQRLTWVESGSARSRVLHFVRPGGWHVLTNFADHRLTWGQLGLVQPSADRILLATTELTQSAVPAHTTAWWR